MPRFTSPGHAPRLCAVYGPMTRHFQLRRHLPSASVCSQGMLQRFQPCCEVTGLPPAAYASIKRQLSACGVAMALKHVDLITPNRLMFTPLRAAAPDELTGPAQLAAACFLLVRVFSR
jgi:hypothetical protein